MRTILLLVVCSLLGCKGKNTNQSTGSATAGSGSAVVAAGSDSGSAGSAMGSAGSAMGSADGSAMGSAAGSEMGSGSAVAAASAGPTITAAGGLSTIGKMMEEDDETVTTKAIEKKIGLPGVTVSFDVMDVGGEVEREEGYFSVKRGDNEIVQLMRTVSGPAAAGPLAVVVWTDEVQTTDGIKKGDTFATLVAKHPDVTCRAGSVADTFYADILCIDPKEKQLSYVISPDKAKIKKGKVEPDTAKILAIGHEF